MKQHLIKQSVQRQKGEKVGKKYDILLDLPDKILNLLHLNKQNIIKIMLMKLFHNVMLVND